jgi:hypothetical protein
LAAFLALAAAAPAPGTVVSGYTAGVVSPGVAYSVPAISSYSSYAGSPVVASYGVHPVGYSSYGYGVPVSYY